MTGGISGVIYVIRHGLRWKDCAKSLWPPQHLIQSLCALEPARGVRPHRRGAGHGGRIHPVRNAVEFTWGFRGGLR